MIKVGILYYGKLASLNGVSEVVKSLINGFSKNCQYDLAVESLDFSYEGNKGVVTDVVPVTADRASKMTEIKQKLHGIFRSLSKKSSLFSYLYFYIQYTQNANTVVSKKGKKLDDVDVLLFQDLFTAWAYRKKFRKEWYNKKVALVMHDNGIPLDMLFDYFPKLKKSKFYSRILFQRCRSIYSEADAIVCLSDFAKRNLGHFSKDLINKCHVIANGIKDIEAPISTTTSTQKIKFVTIGTVSHRKGHDLIMNANLSISKALRAQFAIQVIGDGPYLKEFMRLCKEKGINNIIFEGKRPNAFLYLNSANVFLLPSRNEGLPIAIIEALRAGVPVVSTNVGGIPEIIDNNVNGIIIEPTADMVKEAIIKLVKDKQNIMSLGKNARMTYENKYTIGCMITGYSNLFKKLTDQESC